MVVQPHQGLQLANLTTVLADMLGLVVAFCLPWPAQLVLFSLVFFFFFQSFFLSFVASNLLLALETEACFLFCRWGSSAAFADVRLSEKLILIATCWLTRVTALTPAHTATSPVTVGVIFIDTFAVPIPHCSLLTTLHTSTTSFTDLPLPPLPRITYSPDNEMLLLLQVVKWSEET